MFKNRGIGFKILFISLLGLFFLGAVSLYLYVSDISAESINSQVTRSRAIVLNVESVREEMQEKWDLGLFTAEQLRVYSDNGELEKILATVPVITAWESAMKKSEQGEYQFKVPKFSPRNPENAPDPLEARVLNLFKDTGIEEYYEIDPAINSIRYFRPVVLSETCLYCHGEPSRSEELWGNSRGLDPTGARMEGWDAGEIHGAFEVITSLDQADARVQEAVLTVSGITGVVVLIIILFTLLTIRGITKPLKQIVELSQNVKDGNLQVRSGIESKDEVGQLAEAFDDMVESLSYKAERLEKIADGDLTIEVELTSEQDGLGKSLIRMRDSLHELLVQVKAAIQEVASGSDEVARSSQTLAQGATQQASSIEEVSASLGTVSSQSRENATNAGAANTLANESSSSARQGNSEMEQLSKSMVDINESSSQIQKIVKVIDDIAFQINLLSLNANVEAARAGKYGRGFAVVAEEVRNLAMRSAEAVQETSEMVNNSVNSVERGNLALKRTAGQLKNILESAEKVADIVSEIATASNEQSASINQITDGLDQIEQVTQSNTAAAEEGAAASEELSGQSRMLEELISRFKLTQHTTRLPYYEDTEEY